MVYLQIKYALATDATNALDLSPTFSTSNGSKNFYLGRIVALKISRCRKVAVLVYQYGFLTFQSDGNTFFLIGYASFNYTSAGAPVPGPIPDATPAYAITDVHNKLFVATDASVTSDFRRLAVIGYVDDLVVTIIPANVEELPTSVNPNILIRVYPVGSAGAAFAQDSQVSTILQVAMNDGYFTGASVFTIAGYNNLYESRFGTPRIRYTKNNNFLVVSYTQFNQSDLLNTDSTTGDSIQQQDVNSFIKVLLAGTLSTVSANVFIGYNTALEVMAIKYDYKKCKKSCSSSSSSSTKCSPSSSSSSSSKCCKSSSSSCFSSSSCESCSSYTVECKRKKKKCCKKQKCKRCYRNYAIVSYVNPTNNNENCCLQLQTYGVRVFKLPKDGQIGGCPQVYSGLETGLAIAPIIDIPTGNRVSAIATLSGLKTKCHKKHSGRALVALGVDVGSDTLQNGVGSTFEGSVTIFSFNGCQLKSIANIYRDSAPWSMSFARNGKVLIAVEQILAQPTPGGQFIPGSSTVKDEVVPSEIVLTNVYKLEATNGCDSCSSEDCCSSGTASYCRTPCCYKLCLQDQLNTTTTYALPLNTFPTFTPVAGYPVIPVSGAGNFNGNTTPTPVIRNPDAAIYVNALESSVIIGWSTPFAPPTGVAPLSFDFHNYAQVYKYACAP